jgi:hypothetical protein
MALLARVQLTINIIVLSMGLAAIAASHFCFCFSRYDSIRA